MKHGAWNVVWKVIDHYNDPDEDNEYGTIIGVYSDPNKAAYIALEHEHAPMVSVHMELYKDEWMDKVIK